MYAFSIIVVLECKFKFGTIAQIVFGPKKANDIVNHFLWHGAKKNNMRCHYIFGKLGSMIMFF